MCVNILAFYPLFFSSTDGGICGSVPLLAETDETSVSDAVAGRVDYPHKNPVERAEGDGMRG